MGRILAFGRTVFPVFSAPWLESQCFKVDSLNCVYQGMAADCCGNALVMLASIVPGTRVAERFEASWQRLCRWFRDHVIIYRLQNITPSMVRQPHISPKLRGSAAQWRAIVAFERRLGLPFCTLWAL